MRPTGSLARTITMACCLAAFGFVHIAQANPELVEESLAAVPTSEQQSEYGLRNGSALVVPIPFSNPAIGAGLSLGAGYLFQLAPDADTSFLGVGAMRSDNGSEAYGLGGNLAFGSGWTFDFVLAEAALRYDLFVDDLTFPVEQTGTLFRGGISYEITPANTLGLNLRYLDSDVALRGGGIRPDDISDDSDLELGSFGLSYDWDLRDDGDYPTDGYFFGVSVNRGFSLKNDSRSYEYASANFDMFRTVGEEKVVGGRLSTCATSEDTPFFDKCSIGITDGFRGFSPTRFYDTRLFSAQAEYRQRVGQRFGFVVFGGIGWTGSSYGSLTDNGDRIAGGVGLRYRVTEQFPVDLSLDVSTNNEDEEFVYIFVGQRF